MPDTYTPVLNLVQPEVGASRDTWGTKWNQNATILDQFVSMAMPIGAILDFAGANAPSGWLICDGRAISRTTYAALFAVIGGFYGAGDGSTTFNLPNVNGRALVGAGAMTDQAGFSTSFAFTSSVGFLFNNILQANLPAYNLVTDTQGQHSHGGLTGGDGSHTHTEDSQGSHNHGAASPSGIGTDPQGYHTHGGTTDNPGDHAHSYNMASFGTGAFVQGGGGTTLAINGALTGNAGAHTHNVTTDGQGTHQHNLYWDGLHAHNISFVGVHQHPILADGNHAHNVNLGGGSQAFEVLNPVLVVTKIIYAGTEASTSVMVASAPAPTADRDDELAVIREELAALRALFAPAATRRVTHAPPRGPH